MTAIEDDAVTLAELLKVRLSKTMLDEVDHVVIVKTDYVDSQGWRDEVYPVGEGKVLLVYHKTHLKMLEDVKRELDKAPTMADAIHVIEYGQNSVHELSERVRNWMDGLRQNDKRGHKLLKSGIHRSERISHLERGGYGRRGYPR